MDTYETVTEEHEGYTIRIHCHVDTDMGEPWKEHDGHGIVSEWTRRKKEPGELILWEDHHSFLYYDFAETMKIAKRDGWSVDPLKLEGAETVGEKAAKAVWSDYERLRAWCRGDWHWLGFTSEIEDPEGNQWESDSVWGYDDEKYMLEEARASLKCEIDLRIQAQTEKQIAEVYP